MSFSGRGEAQVEGAVGSREDGAVQEAGEEAERQGRPEDERQAAGCAEAGEAMNW